MSLGETVPLISNIQIPNSGLGNCVLAICERKEAIDTQCNKSARVGLNAVAGIFSALAKVFYIPIALKAGNRIGESRLGIVSAICNCKAFFILEMWAARGIIQDLLGPRIVERTAIEHQKINTCVKASLIIAAITITIFTQIPYALPAADYAHEYKALAGTFSLVASIFIPTRSIQLSLSKLYEKSSSIKKSSTFSKLQKGIVQLIREKQSAFVNSSMEVKNQWIEDLSLIKNLNSPQEKMFSYLKWNFSRPLEISPQLGTCSQKCSKYTSIAIGLFITGVFEYAIAKYSFEKTKELIWNNDIFSGCTAALTTATCLYLYGNAILGTSERVFNGMREWIGCKRMPTLGERLWPKLNISLKIEESITNLFALGPTFVIWGDFFKTPTWKHWFFVTTISTAIYFIISTSSFDTINDITQTLPLDKKKKKVVNQNKEFESLISTFENCPQRDLALFVRDLPEGLKSLLCERIKIPQEELSSCIREILNNDCEILLKVV
ncbi:MAG: hypothetical protein K1000chlam3_00237 [Chlamydiae bacterium]|nr:hypothetical protein [Chlamydiota bacterium]